VVLNKIATAADANEARELLISWGGCREAGKAGAVTGLSHQKSTGNPVNERAQDRRAIYEFAQPFRRTPGFLCAHNGLVAGSSPAGPTSGPSPYADTLKTTRFRFENDSIFHPADKANEFRLDFAADSRARQLLPDLSLEPK
jgi:hypothetical protein